MTEVSEAFLSQFGGVGSSSLTCQCGRQHHAPNSQHVGEQEEREMRAAARADPTRVVLEENVDSVYAKVVGGYDIVPDCPCGTLAKLEQIIWESRAQILAYYKARRDRDAAALAGLDEQS